jgi:hypothetical protein
MPVGTHAGCSPQHSYNRYHSFSSRDQHCPSCCSLKLAQSFLSCAASPTPQQRYELFLLCLSKSTFSCLGFYEVTSTALLNSSCFAHHGLVPRKLLAAPHTSFKMSTNSQTSLARPVKSTPNMIQNLDSKQLMHTRKPHISSPAPSPPPHPEKRSTKSSPHPRKLSQT